MRALIVSLNTYSSSFNDQKLVELGQRIEDVTAVAGDVSTMWGTAAESRFGSGYRVHALRARFRRTNATTFLSGLGKAAREARPSVLHVECEPWQAVAVQSILLARRLGIPMGVQFAENGPQLGGVGGHLRMLVARRVLRSCQYAIGWSEESADIARRLAPGVRVEAYPGTGVTMPLVKTPRNESGERWFSDGPDGAKLAFVGRFSPEKGLEDFLEIAARLAERIGVQAAIAGGAPSDPMVNGWVASRPWARVHGVLERPQVAELLEEADVLVCPSRTTTFAKEQFGKVPVEAMALGTPVFAFDCGALRQVVGSGGVVVEEGAGHLLVDELERYFQAPQSLRTEFAERARAQALQFTDAALAEALIRLWSALPTSDPDAGRLP